MNNKKKYCDRIAFKLKDNFWLWGQTPGSHHAENNNRYKLPGENKMTPAEGCAYLDIHNCCRVVMESMPAPPFDNESKALAHLKQVVWSIIGSGGSARNDVDWGDLEEVIRQAKMFPNIKGGILDDFLNKRRRSLFPPEKIVEIRNKLNAGAGRPLDLWVVLYDHELDYPIRPYLDNCDVITFWTWNGSELINLDRNFERLVAMTSNKRRLAGCYMWNYGEARPLEIKEMEFQCEKYFEYMKKGYIEGIIFCSNCIADLGLEAVEWTKNWIKQISDEKF